LNNNLEGVDKARPITEIRSIGTSGIERYGGYIYEEFLTKLINTQYLKVFKEMAYNDSTVGAILFIFEQMIRRVPWSVEPGGETEEDIQAAQFLKECMDDMSHSWLDFITESLSMFPFGWSWHELCYKYRRGYNDNPDRSSKYNDNRIGWSKIPRRMQTSWNRWVYSDQDPDELLGMEQLAANAPKAVIIPLAKSIHFKTKPMGGNPEGISLLRNAYRSWYFKKRLEEIEGIGAERELAGMPVITTPEGVNPFDTNDPDAVALLAELQKLISNIRMDKNYGAILPFGYVLDLMSAGGTRAFNTTEIINRYDQRIAMTMLSDIVMLGTEKSGSFALADVKKSLLAVALEAQVWNIADTINKQAVPKLIKLNTFNVEKFPKAIPGEIESPDMVELADAMQRFADMGFPMFPNEKLENYIWSNFGFPESDEKKNKREENLEIDLEEQGEKLEQSLELNQEYAPEPTINNGSKDKKDGKSKPIPPRKRSENQTDDKSRFNDTYERNGLKKIVDSINRLSRIRGKK